MTKKSGINLILNSFHEWNFRLSSKEGQQQNIPSIKLQLLDPTSFDISQISLNIGLLSYELEKHSRNPK